jgi:trans-2,3-dihydro-3-hydroxyanthranilate isomerase
MNKSYLFYQIDAFTDDALAGNPCAILFDCDNLKSELMLQITKENNLSETAFVMKSDKADAKVRFFTPAHELPFAGHPTIATAHALFEKGIVPPESKQISLEMPAGIIKVDIIKTAEKRLYVMTQNKPEFFEYPDINLILKAFNITQGDLVKEARPQVVSTGLKQLMILVKNQEVLKRLKVDYGFYDQLRKDAKFFSAHLFCLDSIDHKTQTFARQPADSPSESEDPFTGSATGNMAAYLWHHSLINSPKFIAKQGHWLNRPGQAIVEVEGEPDDILSVKVGGGAVTTIKGNFFIGKAQK